MLRKAFLTTTALIAASSLALGGPNKPMRPPATPAMLRQQHRDALVRKGMILNPKGVPIAVFRPPVSPSRNSAPNRAAQPPLFVPGKHDHYSNFGARNALYMAWFGWFARKNATHSTPSGSFCYSYSGTTCINHYKYKESFTDNMVLSAAQPFSDLKAASSISLGVAAYSGSAEGAVALYSNTTACASSATASCPGNPVAGASGGFVAPPNSGYCCGDIRTVTFTPVHLRKAKKYWVVVSANTGSGVLWFGENGNLTISAPRGEYYNYTITEVLRETYGTTRYHNSHYTYHFSTHGGSNGWIHTAGFSLAEVGGAFAINDRPP
jgi:hypothetical protein